MSRKSWSILWCERGGDWVALLMAMCCIMASACGYRFSGSGQMPQGIEDVFIPVVGNRSSETGLENIMTDALVYEFALSGVHVPSDRKEADAILSGVISSALDEPASRSSTRTITEKRVTVTLDLKLVTHEGEVVWSRKGITGSETYTTGLTKPESRIHKKAALETVTQRIAELVYQNITANF